jgi:uncharacterized RDD family membrane protein YckC
VVAGDPARAARLAEAQAAAQRVHRPRRADPGGTVYAGLVTRTLAFAFDAALINLAALTVGVVAALVLSVLPVSDDLEVLLAAIGGVLFAVWVVAYFATFWTATGETPGNRAMRIRVARVDGRPLRPRHALLRLVGILLSLPLFAGFVPILFNERRRGLHDVLAGTVVVAKRPEPTA